MEEAEVCPLDRINDACIALDEEWRFTFVNQQAAALIGRDRLDLLGRSIWAELPALSSDTFHSACLQAMTQQTPLRLETHEAEQGRWIEHRLYPSPDGMIILFTNATERMAQESNLRQYKDIFRLAEIGLVIGTGDGPTLEMINPAFARMHGYETEELQGRPMADVYAPEARGELASHVRRAVETGHNVYESVHLHKDGTEFPVSVDTTAVKGADGRVLYHIINVIDSTDRKRTEAALQEAVRRLETLISSLQVGILVEDRQSQVILTNQALCDMMGLDVPPGALVGTRMSLFNQRIRTIFADPERLLTRLADIHRGREPLQGEEMPLADGRMFELDYSPVFGEGGGYHLWQLRDATDRRRIERQLRETSATLEAQKRELETANTRLEELATTDGLTGLLNQRVFGERLIDEFRRAHRYGEPLSLIILDVDHFKTYNDSFGHLAGNTVLQELSEVLRKHARETDLVARFGGEEFALILPHTEAAEAIALAVRLRAGLESTVWSAQYPITASFGVCALSAEMVSPDQLVAGADAAMYRAKADGRNRVVSR